MSSEPAAIGLDEIEDANVEPAAAATGYARVSDSELLTEDASADVSGERAVETSAVETSAVETSAVETSAALKTPVVADQTPQPSEGDIPDFRPRKRGRAMLVATIASAAAIVVAGVAWSRFVSHEERPTARAAAPAPERTPERTPAPPAPTPAPPPVAAAPAAAPSAPTAAVEGAVGKSGEKSPTAITVTVKTVPEEAVIFRAGKRLGTGMVEVSVERNVKERLTALHDGYLPSNFVLDGSRDSLTVRLKRIPKPRVEAAGENPYASAPSTDATTTSAPAPTVDPAATAAPPATAAFPTGTPQPAPDVSSSTPPP